MSDNPDDIDDNLCPLCTEEMDITDRSFRPCKCGYQICLWCYNNIMENLGGRCPACRGPYDRTIRPPDPSILSSAREETKRKQKSHLAMMQTPANVSSTVQMPRQVSAAEKERERIALGTDRQALMNVRVMQRNLVYVIGLAPSLAKEEVLKEKNYFGKYGRIVKIAVNKKQVHGDAATRSYSAYITFKSQVDALEAIRALDGTMLGDRQVRCTFGTTKYCSMFLRHAVCTNPTCLYLHEIAKDSDYIIAPDEAAMSAVERFTQQNEAIFAQEDAKTVMVKKKITAPAPIFNVVTEEPESTSNSAEDEQRLQQEDDEWRDVYNQSSDAIKPPPGLVSTVSFRPDPVAFPALGREKDVFLQKKDKEAISLETLLPGLAFFGPGKFNPGLGSNWTPAPLPVSISSLESYQVVNAVPNLVSNNEVVVSPAAPAVSSQPNSALNVATGQANVQIPAGSFRSVTSMFASASSSGTARTRSRFAFATADDVTGMPSTATATPISALPIASVYSTSVVNTAAAMALRVLNQTQSSFAPNASIYSSSNSGQTSLRDSSFAVSRPGTVATPQIQILQRNQTVVNNVVYSIPAKTSGSAAPSYSNGFNNYTTQTAPPNVARIPPGFVH